MRLIIFRIKENVVQTNDNLFMNMYAEESKFYSIGSRDKEAHNFAAKGDDYITIYFHLSQEYDLYQRSVFTFFDMFGQFGGMYQILVLFGSILVSKASTMQFKNSILSRLYHVESKTALDISKIHPNLKEVKTDSFVRVLGEADNIVEDFVHKGIFASIF